MRKIKKVSSKDDHVYLTASEAAAKLNVSIATLYTYVSRKKVRAVKSEGRESRYLKADVERLIAGPDQKMARVILPASRITSRGEAGVFYRGVSVLELYERASLEQVARLLWECDDDPFEEEPIASPPSWDAFREIVSPFSPHDRISMLLPVLEGADIHAHDTSPQGLRRSGANILRWSAAIAVGRSSPPEGPIHHWIAETLPTGSDLSEVFRRVLVLAADRGIDATVHAVRAAASTGATPYRCIISGLATATGSQLPSARTSAFGRFLREIEGSADPREPILVRIREAEPIPGFSYTPSGFGGRDVRAAALWAYLSTTLADDARFQRTHRALLLAAEVTGRQPEFLFLAACVGRLAGADSSLNLVRLGRITGWLAHAFDQRLWGSPWGWAEDKPGEQ